MFENTKDMEDIEEGMMVVLGLLLSEKSGKKRKESVFIYVRFRVPQSAGWLRCVSRHISWSSDSGVISFPHTRRFFIVNK